MVRKKKSARAVSVYSNLANKRRTKKDAKSRRKAEYLASLPKHPLKRIAHRLHPKRLAAFWFSRQGALMALKIVGVSILVVILLGGALVAYYRKDLDAIRPGEIDKRVQTTVTKYYDRNDKLLWEDKGDGDYKLVVKDDQINTYMKQATVAIEDKDFYKHGGVSVTGVVRAALSNTQGNSTQGGSTLTQQLVKQVFFSDESQQRGLAGIPRKIKEMILSIEVEKMYEKDQILNLYLNESPYGGRRNGVESAAQTYFGKSAKDLTLAESALLASVPNQPGLYDPYNVEGHSALIARQQKVLDSMVDMKYITRAQADEAKKVAILDTVKPLADQLDNIKAPHFVLMVRSQLEKNLGKATVGNGGLIVKTTLDLDIQTKLEQSMADMFNSSWPAYAGFTNGAGVVEDVKTGQIVAMVGSRDFKYQGYGQDNAATAFIQPGSSIKPLVFAQLFQNQGDGKQNFGSGSILADTATTFEGNYKPQDADGKFKGNISIRTGLDLSRNIPAIKAMAIAGKDETWKTIRELGNKNYCTQGPESQAGLSSAIGGCGTRMVDHVNALASLGRMGVYSPWTGVLEVRSSTGEVLKKFKAEQKQVIDPQAAYIVNDILGDANARRPLIGSDTTINIDRARVKVAIKTGTSDRDKKPKDIWGTGYTPSLSMNVWLGNPDTSPLTNGNSRIPLYILDEVMAYATQLYRDQGKIKEADEWFTAPEGIQRIGNEIYPSYYNKRQSIKNTSMSFDRVSKKLATECTPAAAKIDVGVSKVVDPFTKKEVVSADDGYDATKNDDVHSCADARPSVSVNISGNGKTATVTYTNGKFTLQSIEVKRDGSTIASKQLGSAGSWNVEIPEGGGNKFTVTATVTDTGYYTADGSDTKD